MQHWHRSFQELRELVSSTAEFTKTCLSEFLAQRKSESAALSLPGTMVFHFLDVSHDLRVCLLLPTCEPNVVFLAGRCFFHPLMLYVHFTCVYAWGKNGKRECKKVRERTTIMFGRTIMYLQMFGRRGLVGRRS